MHLKHGRHHQQVQVTRPTMESRATLGHLRSINPNTIVMITRNHFANQSLLKTIFFNTEKKLWKVV